MPATDYYEAIREKLYGLQYPCTLVVYGPSRETRTKYRGEHSEAFGIDTVQNCDEAWNLVERAGYAGYPPDLEIYAVAQSVTEIKNCGR